MARPSFLYTAAFTFLSIASLLTAEQLKPGQQAAKDHMTEDAELAHQLEFAKKVCGTELKISSDLSTYSADEWKGQSVADRLSQIIVGIESVCNNKAYKPALVKSLTTVNVTFGGQGGKDALPNFSMQGSTLTYKMNKENVNLSDKAATFVRQQLDK